MSAENQHVKPEVPYFLAADPDPGVRTAIARNQATPVQADVILARDAQETVRADLAAKIARFAPDLRPDETDRLKAMTYQVLETLIQDQAVRVRRVVAETLKDMKTARSGWCSVWRATRNCRSRDRSLQYSPVLTDEDLLDIVRQLPIPGAAAAIARRRRLGTAVADEIGNGTDVDADHGAAVEFQRADSRGHVGSVGRTGRRNTRPGTVRWSTGRNCRAMPSRSLPASSHAT
ncbi:MAG: hypothetical protein WDN69_09395 [Aliidongia sp.]